MSEKHVSPSGLEFPNPENSITHEDAGPIYVSPLDEDEDGVDNE